jgi:dihydroflavonol-4-reductase
MRIDPPWDQRLARASLRPLMWAPITPNQITTVSLGIRLLAAFLYVRGGWAAHLGAACFVLSLWLDHVDGELARSTGRTSAFGHYYDLAAECCVLVAVFVGIGEGMPGFGVAAGLGTTAIFVLRMELERRAGKAAIRQPNLLGFELEGPDVSSRPDHVAGVPPAVSHARRYRSASVRAVRALGVPPAAHGAANLVTTLVTGATGFVGSAVLRALLRRGEPVRALVRPSSSLRLLEGLAVEIVTGDLGEPASCRAPLRGCDALFHVAADYRLWVPQPAAMYRTNVEGTRELLLAAAAAGVSRIVYTSSVATLGLRADRLPSDEATPAALADMIGHYKRSKFLAEQAVRALVADSGLPVVIVNPSAPVGPADARPTPTGRVLLEAARGRIPAYVDTGLNLVHVDDVAEGHLLAFERGRIGERYILGGDNLPLGKMLAQIANLVGRKPPRLRLPSRALLPVAVIAEAIARLGIGGEPLVTADGVRMARKPMYFTSAKAERELGYRSRPAVEGLRDAIDWYRSCGYLR